MDPVSINFYHVGEELGVMAQKSIDHLDDDYH